MTQYDIEFHRDRSSRLHQQFLDRHPTREQTKNWKRTSTPTGRPSIVKVFIDHTIKKLLKLSSGFVRIISLKIQSIRTFTAKSKITNLKDKFFSTLQA